MGMLNRTLTDLEKRILEFASEGGHHRAGEIYLEFRWHPTSYFQRLFELLNDPAAEAAYPQVVHRERRLRDQRAAARAHRTFRSA